MLYCSLLNPPSLSYFPLYCCISKILRLRACQHWQLRRARAHLAHTNSWLISGRQRLALLFKAPAGNLDDTPRIISAESHFPSTPELTATKGCPHGSKVPSNSNKTPRSSLEYTARIFRLFVDRHGCEIVKFGWTIPLKSIFTLQRATPLISGVWRASAWHLLTLSIVSRQDSSSEWFILTYRGV